MRFIFQITILTIVAVSVVAVHADDTLGQRAIVLLSRRCFACHGPDENAREADLRLDEPKFALLAVGSSGRAIIKPGNHQQSELFHRVVSNDEDLRMPPLEHGPALKSSEVTLLKSWIDDGADWPIHWSFRPVERPAIPPVTATDELKLAARSQGAIDRFIRARLLRAGLLPSKQADRRTLIRRVTLDLTGLPPTPVEVQAFVSDPRPDAYERVVDRLLASPAFGERWATMWLDLARYADSRGYEQDNPRQAWPWRDWVVDAYNTDMSYRQFTIEQLAGDMLPSPTHSQLLATAFHRNTMTNDEGGTDDEEYRIAAVKDRVDVTMQVWMGLTAGCAKCHSHKYDPISHREYYQLYAIFNQSADADRADDAPTMRLPTYEHEKEEARIRNEIAAIEKKLATPDKNREQEFQEWTKNLREGPKWQVLTPSNVFTASGSDVIVQPDSSVVISGRTPFTDSYLIDLPLDLPQVTAIRIETIPDENLPAGGAGRERGTGKFVLSSFTAIVQKDEFDLQRVRFSSAVADHSQYGWSIEHALRGSDTRRLGWAVGPYWRERHVAIFKSARPIKAGKGSQLVIRMQHAFPKDGLTLGRFRISATADDDPNLDAIAPDNIVAMAKIPAKDRTPEQNRQLYRRHAYQTKKAEVDLRHIDSLERSISQLNVPQTPIMEELTGNARRETHIHKRGNFLAPGEAVSANVPKAWHAFPPNEEVNRRSLADWLLDDANPLVDRVAVNRVWARLFGIGLVETEEDFGSQGTMPSHPKLLDYLAYEFKENGRSHKWLCRQIVLSATYRQSSRVNKSAVKVDPQNRLLSYSPRFRLSAEQTRDAALSAGGLLSRTLHGPPVMPPQPEGIWAHVFSEFRWNTSVGENRYRRGLYTYLRRTAPYPAMAAMDGPSREVCTPRRIRTNTPLAALVTLNDPAFVEAAQSLGRRLAHNSFEQSLPELYLTALGRLPKPQEKKIMFNLFAARLAKFNEHTTDAKQFAGLKENTDLSAEHIANIAAWTALANVVLNLDEFLVRP